MVESVKQDFVVVKCEICYRENVEFYPHLDDYPICDYCLEKQMEEGID